MAYLADTSLWVEHFRKKNGDPELRSILNNESVFIHDFIFGELLLGGLNESVEVKELLELLPRATRATQLEVETIIYNHKITGSGIGWVDVHLIASCLLDHLDLITKDKKLQQIWNRIADL